MGEHSEDYDSQLQQEIQTVFDQSDQLRKTAEKINERIDSVWNFLDRKLGENDIGGTDFSSDANESVGNELNDNEPVAIQTDFHKMELFHEVSSIRQVVDRLESVLGEKSVTKTDREQLSDCLESIRRLPGGADQATDLTLERSENNESFTENFSSMHRSVKESVMQFDRLIRSFSSAVLSKIPNSIGESLQHSLPERKQDIRGRFTTFNFPVQEESIENSRADNRFQPGISNTESVWTTSGNRSNIAQGENISSQILMGQDSIKAIMEKNNRNVIELLQQTVSAIKESAREDYTLEIG